MANMTPKFTGPLVLEDLDGRHWMLKHNLTLVDRDNRKWTVPAGFITDLASIPRFLWVSIPPIGLYDYGAVIHDHIYTYQYATKEAADDLLLQGMEARGVGWYTRHKIYWAVKFFGKRAWDEHTRELDKGVPNPADK